jgi:hypothetical protein
MKKLPVLALAAFAALAACKKDDAVAGGDTTAMPVDTTAVAAPAPAPMATDTTMAAPVVDSTAPTDTTVVDTTKKM